MNPSADPYRAFISYSQRDRQHAKRLHSVLESYRVPKGIDAPLQPNRRLGRFFRDDDEMGASNDLGAALRDALKNSENLVVICSPNAARSKWVDAEIEHFKDTGRGERIFAVVVDGTPNSGDPGTECFPPALRPDVTGEEEEQLLSARHAEPLGIDLRKERFGRARIRLAAGLLGINFDSLWQREKRRTAKRRAIAALVTAALGAVIAVLGVQWFRERGRSRAQRVDRTLVRVRDDLASERVRAALVELGSLYDEGERGPVEGALKTTLSWASTPAELLKEVKPPAFITNGPALFFVASDGSRHRVNVSQPERRVLSSDKRRLLLIGSDEAIMLDTSDGRELARANSNQISWSGSAFETPDKLLVVAGQFAGISNGTLRESLLVYSPRRQTLSVFDQHLNAGGGGGQYRFLHPLAVGEGCRGFGVIREGYPFEKGVEDTQPSDMFFFSADADGLKPSAAPGSVDDWSLATIFEDDGLLNEERRVSGYGVTEVKGCAAPAADSARREAQPPVAGPPRPVGLGAFWESERRWKAADRTDTEAQQLGREGSAVADNSPCTEKRPCPVQDYDKDSGDKMFEGFEVGMPGWTPVTPPRGVRRDDRSFDSVDKEFVYAGHDIANAGFRSAWCRRVNSKAVCLEMGTGAELNDERTEIDLRSNTGRFIFYPRGAARGFHLYDLSTMRDVTPRGPELVVSTHQTDFGPDDKRLFLTLNGRLLVFTAPPGGGQWQQLNEGVAAQIPALSGNAEDAVAGLLALDDNDLVVVRGSGLVSRFDWRTGRQSWGRTVGGVGDVYRVAVSKNRRFLLVVGRAGARLLDTADGLVLSGVLVPPPLMEGSVETVECFKEVFVTDAGAVEAPCGEKMYLREPVAFGGDVRARLREILSDESEAAP
jgi:hypothetical protein